jgi:uncharacterized membrane protein
VTESTQHSQQHSQQHSRWSDHAVEQLIGRLLQVGVLLAAIVTMAGGAMLLTQHGGDVMSFTVFQGEPAYLRSIGGVVRSAVAMRSESIVQLGLVLLIATPVVRVAFTLVAFVLQRDRTYVAITSLVLVLLLYGLLYGSA